MPATMAGGKVVQNKELKNRIEILYWWSYLVSWPSRLVLIHLEQISQENN